MAGPKSYVAVLSGILIVILVFAYFATIRTPPFFVFVRDPATPLVLDHTEPAVIKVGSTFYLYYRIDHSIGIANSTDGLNWTDITMAINASRTGWDSGEVIAPSILSDNGSLYLYYEGLDKTSGVRAIGVAISNSPTGPFTKYSGNPVLTPSASWEGSIVGTPVVVRDSLTYYLFYHGYNGADRMGVAYSQNPTGPWTKDTNNPVMNIGDRGSWDGMKVAPSSALVVSGGIWIFYEGFNGKNNATLTSFRIGIACAVLDLQGRVSRVTRQPGPALDLGPPGSWDNNTVQRPDVVVGSANTWMYYSGHNGLAFHLGRARGPLLTAQCPSAWS